MDEPTAQTSEQTLPGLIRFTLEHLRNLRLKGPPNFQHEQYAEVWQALAAAGNSLIDQIENLRFEGHEQWETGDEASIQQFGSRFAVPQGKEFMRNVLRELGSLGTFEADDVEKEDVEQESLKEGAIQKEVIGRKAIKTEAVETPPQDTVLPSIERRSTLLFLPKTSAPLTKHSYQLVQDSHSASSSRLQDFTPWSILLAHHTAATQQRFFQHRSTTPTPPVSRRPTLPVLPLIDQLQRRRGLAFHVRRPHSHRRAKGSFTSTTARLSACFGTGNTCRARVHGQRETCCGEYRVSCIFDAARA